MLLVISTSRILTKCKILYSDEYLAVFYDINNFISFFKFIILIDLYQNIIFTMYSTLIVIV